jgi:hypothetical protein
MIIAVVIMIACQNKDSIEGNIVLKVDEWEIDLNTFRITYESDPSFPGHKSGVEGLMEYAEKISDHILAEKLGVKEKIYNSEPFKDELEYIKREATIRAYYKHEIKDNIHISENEMHSAFQKMSVRLKVKHLFAPTREEAEALYELLESGIPFDTLAQQVFKNVGTSLGVADLGEIRWGDLETNIEEQIFRLSPNRYSKPVASRWGYHILLVTARSENIMLTENDFNRQRSFIYLKLKQQKEVVSSANYLKNYLDPISIKVKSEPFNRIVQILQINRGEQRGGSFERFQPFQDSHIELLQSRLAKHMDLPFMESAKENWDLGQFLNKVRRLPHDKRPEISSPAQLKKDIGIMIRNEFLFNKAAAEGFINHPSVDSTIKIHTQKIAYVYYLNKFYSTYRPVQDVVDYYKKKPDERTQISNTILRGMTSLERYKLYYASRKLHSYLTGKFSGVTIEINENLLRKESSKINWNQPLRMFIPQ